MDKWQYMGSVDVQHGGAYFAMETYDDGYVDCVRITDLDSACGFDGAVMVEHVIVLVGDAEQTKQAMRCCGLSEDELSQYDKESRRMAIVNALLYYGYYDPNNGRGHNSEIIQTEDDGPIEFDSWKAEKRVSSDDLEGYVKAKHLY